MPHEPNWEEYYDATSSRPLHFLYEHLQPLLIPPGRALEIGCGVGTGAIWLAEQGYSLLAVDQEKGAIDRLISRKPDYADIEFQMIDIQSLPIDEESFDLIVAQFSLFFIPEGEFEPVWEKIVKGLVCQGIFMGTFLGPRDSWAGQYIHHDYADVMRLMRDFDVVYHQEDERDGTTSLGDSKHWHVHHVIARRI